MTSLPTWPWAVGPVSPAHWTIGQMFTWAFRIVRREPALTWGLGVAWGICQGAVALVVPDWAWEAYIDGLSGRELGVTPAEASGAVVKVAAVALVSFLVSLVFQAAASYLLARRLVGLPVRLGQALGQGGKRYGALLGTMVLIYLVVIGIGLVLFFVLAAFRITSLSLGLLLIMAYVAGSLVWAVRTILAPLAAVLEEVGPITAIRRSMKLTKPGFFAVLGATLLTFLVAGVISLVVQQAVGTPMLLASKAAWTATAITIIGMVVSGPLQVWSTAVSIQVYLRQRGRNEGFLLPTPPMVQPAPPLPGQPPAN